VRVIELTGDQPAAVPPLGQAPRRGAAYSRQGIGQAGHVVHLHKQTLPLLPPEQSWLRAPATRGLRGQVQRRGQAGDHGPQTVGVAGRGARSSFSAPQGSVWQGQLKVGVLSAKADQEAR